MHTNLEISECQQRRDNLIFAGLPMRYADAVAATNDTLAGSSESVTRRVILISATMYFRPNQHQSWLAL